MANKCRRKAIIISAPGVRERAAYTAMINNSVNHIRRYLLSDTGGSWYENEIVVLPDDLLVKKWDAFTAINLQNCDYLYLHYLGHGGNYQNKDVIQLLPGIEIPVNDLLLNVRQCLVIDACRSIVPTPQRGLSDQLILESHRYLTNTRSRYDDLILSTPHGQIIIQSTQLGEVAKGNPSGLVFTNHLINAANKLSLRTENLNKHASIWNICNLAVPAMHNEPGISQIPVCACTEDMTSLPFAIAPITVHSKEWP